MFLVSTSIIVQLRVPLGVGYSLGSAVVAGEFETQNMPSLFLGDVALEGAFFALFAEVKLDDIRVKQILRLQGKGQKTSCDGLFRLGKTGSRFV